MRRLTFRVASSSFLATSVLMQAASNLSERYPLSSAELLSDFYVDYCLSDAFDITGALSLQQKLYQLLNDVGLVLRKTTISTALVTSKTRVAPVKNRLILPKLELFAGLLTARLLKVVGDDLNFLPDKWYCLCNSNVVLGWIHNSSIKWKVLVSYWVSKLVNITPSKQWRYVTTVSYPADHASRGITPVALTICFL